MKAPAVRGVRDRRRQLDAARRLRAAARGRRRRRHGARGQGPPLGRRAGRRRGDRAQGRQQHRHRLRRSRARERHELQRHRAADAAKCRREDLVATIGDIARTTAKVRNVHNEITVGPGTDVGSRTNDSYITSKVKARFVEANKFAPDARQGRHRAPGRLPDGARAPRRSRYRRADREHDIGRRARRQAVRVHQLGARIGALRRPRRCPKPRYPAKSPTPRRRRRASARSPRPLVFTNGVFDLLHRGHVTYLEQAKALGASLVVAVNSDASVRRLGKGADRPLNALEDRMAVLAALACVDLVVPFDADTPLDADRRLRARRAGEGRRLFGGDDGGRRRSASRAAAASSRFPSATIARHRRCCSASAADGATAGARAPGRARRARLL